MGRIDSADPFFLRTARLGFRTWTEDDLPLALGLWGDPEVTRFIDARGALTREQVHRRLLDEIAGARDHGIQYWPIFLRVGGDHVGCCGLRPRDSLNRILELGFHIRREKWKQGFAAEAASAVIVHAFGVLGARGLFAGHHPSHHDSKRLLLGLGFEHTHDEHYAATGLLHPSYLLKRPAP
jgi:RimJ/RimL family protein N-acetyltransferase